MGFNKIVISSRNNSSCNNSLGMCRTFFFSLLFFSFLVSCGLDETHVYDGDYDITTTVLVGSCSPIGFSTSIENGNISGIFFDPLSSFSISVVGSVDEDGLLNAVFDYSNGDSGRAFVRMGEAGVGTGTWQNTFGCSGRIFLARR